ncbi:hypothetical protein Chor_013371 [Crotalus horridus]
MAGENQERTLRKSIAAQQPAPRSSPLPPANSPGAPRAPSPDSGDPERVALKKEIGLISACAIIIGNIIGSGIFISPKGVLEHSGSVGLALIIWILGGGISALGSLCYAELGVTIPKSGGDYSYVTDIFGGLAGSSVRWATRIQDIFTAGKLLALGLIITVGFVQIFKGNYEPLIPSNAFSFWMTPSVGHLALAFLQGSFAFSGWNFLNYVTEELVEPRRNLPRAIFISIPLVTFVYTFTNIAYFTAMSPQELLSSNAVAVTFGEKLLGYFSWVMPVSVALSTFGGINGYLFTSSRLCFSGAREGHLPSLLAMIHVKHCTPIPALLVCVGVSVPVELVNVNLLVPITYLIFWAFLLIFSFYSEPVVCGIGLVIILTGVPVFFLGVYWKNKPKCVNRITESLTHWGQKICFVVYPQKESPEDDLPITDYPSQEVKRP